MNRRTFLSFVTAIGVGGGLILAGCGDDSDEASSSGDAITIEGAWARTSPMMADTGAAYLTITSAADDALLSASADASIAGKVELHETRMVEGDAGMTATTMEGAETTESGDTMAPAMEMVPVDTIDLPAGEAVALAPGGLHIMLLDLPAPLELDQTFTLTLTFEDAGTRDVQVTVRDDAP